MEGVTAFGFPPIPFHPHHLRHAIPDITVAVKKVALNPAVLAS